MDDDVRIAVDARIVLGEGAIWSVDEQRLYWTDIEARMLWRFDPVSGTTEHWEMPGRVCSFGFREKGGLLIAFDSRISFYDLSAKTEVRIVEVEKELPTTRLNDGRCDRQGRFVVGGYDADGKNQAGAYRLDGDLSLHRLFGGLSSANSTCFNLDGSIMYFTNTPEAEIWEFDYDIASGIPSNKRTFCGFAGQPGLPDDSTIDAEGFLWNAQWNGSRVVRYRPDGRIDRVIEVPFLNPTCLAFGGSELDTLYVTTARFMLSDSQLREQPLAGALLELKPGVKGLAEVKFRG